MSNELNSSKLFIGENSVVENADRLCAVGKKALIVTGKNAAERCGALDDVKKALSAVNAEYVIYNGILPNPTIASCREAGAMGSDCDTVIGIGGGSPLDAAKAAAVFAKNPDISEADFYAIKWAKPPLSVIAVGTTAGTGSEVTPVAVITDSLGRKKSIRDDAILPRFAFGDAKYTMNLPDAVTRSTAADAAAHCIESYFNKKATDESKRFAIMGMKLLIPELETISAYGTDGLDKEDREALYSASIYAGYAIAVTGTAFPHTLSYYLSEHYNIPHGTACAMFLPAFIIYNQNIEPLLTAEFFEELARTADEVRGLLDDVANVPELTMTNEEISSLAPRWEGNNSLAKCLGNVDGEYVKNLLTSLFM